MGFVGSSLWQVRQKIGNDPVVWPGCSLVVVNPAGQVLLGKRADTGTWSVLGGVFELGDSAESCARRELQEEAGLEALSATVFGILSDPAITRYTYPNGHEIQSPSTFFEMRVDGTLLALDDEHEEMRWMDVREALDMKMKSGVGGYTSMALKAYCAWKETGQFQVL